jgi:hypothetical protein
VWYNHEGYNQLHTLMLNIQLLLVSHPLELVDCYLDKRLMKKEEIRKDNDSDKKTTSE